MFHQLLESNAVQKPRVGGSLVSTLAHAALVAAAVALTTQPDHPRPVVPDRIFRYTPVVPTPVVPSTTVHGSRASANPQVSDAPAPSPSTMPRVFDIVVGIPSIDLTRPVTDASDFSSTRGPGGSATNGIGTGSGPGDGSAWLAEQVDKPVMMLPGIAALAYPPLLRSAGVSGGVLMEFVVDTLGRVEPGSQRVVQADHQLFAASVRDVMPRLRFMPAEARGRKVRQLVHLPFRFDINPER